MKNKQVQITFKYSWKKTDELIAIEPPFVLFWGATLMYEEQWLLQAINSQTGDAEIFPMKLMTKWQPA